MSDVIAFKDNVEQLTQSGEVVQIGDYVMAPNNAEKLIDRQIAVVRGKEVVAHGTVQRFETVLGTNRDGKKLTRCRFWFRPAEQPFTGTIGKFNGYGYTPIV